MNAFLAIPESDPRVKPKLDPSIWVEPRDRDPRSEDSRQAEYVATTRKLCRWIKVFAVPNGTNIASRAGRAKVRREGLCKGWPDTGACWATTVSTGIAWIEFKSGTGAPDDDQIATLNWLHARGHPVAVCRTANGAIGWLRSIGAPIPMREGL